MRMLRTLPVLMLFAVTVAFVGSNDVEEHCAAEVVGQDEVTGELLLSDPICYTGDDAQAMATRAVMGADTEIVTEDGRIVEVINASSSVLAWHYDGPNYTSSSFTVVGSNCNGGYVNLSAAWKDRVSSTLNNLCWRVKHWSAQNASGSLQSTWGGGNLSYMNNRAESISYHTS